MYTYGPVRHLAPPRVDEGLPGGCYNILYCNIIYYVM